MVSRSGRIGGAIVLVGGMVIGVCLMMMGLTRSEPGFSLGAGVAFLGALIASFGQAWNRGVRW